MIETQVGNRIPVPAMLRALVREQSWSLAYKPALPPRVAPWRRRKKDSLHKVGADIWVTWEPVDPHTDDTKDGLCTYGMILANDPQVLFVHGQKEYEIPPGTLYKMDGRIEHSTEGACGLFAALIWDMPPVWTLADFANELARDERFKP